MHWKSPQWALFSTPLLGWSPHKLPACVMTEWPHRGSHGTSWRWTGILTVLLKNGVPYRSHQYTPVMLAYIYTSTMDPSWDMIYWYLIDTWLIPVAMFQTQVPDSQTASFVRSFHSSVVCWNRHTSLVQLKQSNVAPPCLTRKGWT